MSRRQMGRVTDARVAKKSPLSQCQRPQNDSQSAAEEAAALGAMPLLPVAAGALRGRAGGEAEGGAQEGCPRLGGVAEARPFSTEQEGDAVKRPSAQAP